MLKIKRREQNLPTANLEIPVELFQQLFKTANVSGLSVEELLLVFLNNSSVIAAKASATFEELLKEAIETHKDTIEKLTKK